MRRTTLMLAAVLGCIAGATPVGAAPVVYTFQGVGNGSLGGSAFNNAAFTITVDSDTNLVTPFSFVNNGFTNNGFSISPSPARIDVTGFGTASFTGGEKVFVNNSTVVLGFQPPSNSDFLDLNHPTFATYDLKSSTGPLAVTTDLRFGNQFVNVATSAGLLNLSGLQPNVTFQARVVPEPTGVALLGLGVLGMLGLGRVARSRGPFAGC